MRPVMLALLAALVAAVGPARAELQWVSSGVRPASHTEPTPPVPTAAVRRAVKAPTFRAPSVVPPVAQSAPKTPAVRQAVAQAPAPLVPVVAPPVAEPRIDAAVETACGHCGCVGGCSCGVDATCELPGCACGVDPGCGFDPGCAVAPGCGVPVGPACGCGDAACGGDCGSVCGCGDACDGSCGVPVTFMLPPVRELTFEAGVQAFKNPLDAGRDRGNFGLNLGVNLGGSMGWLGVPAIGYQVGYRAASSQLHGDATLDTPDAHTQSFVTAGLFRRRPVGLQWGVVYDMLRDERQGSEDFGQVRGSLSLLNPRGHELGFQFARHLNENELPIGSGVVYHATDQYLLFYRLHGAQGGEFRVFGGFDDDNKGIVGTDFSVPLTDRFSLETGFVYVIPEEDPGANEESWNLGTSLVWHYGCRARRSCDSPYRPMFRVADNSTVIVDDRRP